uniref:non-specific serine/threonine protein kinase n=1 Tax=Clastoptera arizonana TaxID=38151 RepID=A0A1B6DXX2_9HEMI
MPPRQLKPKPRQKKVNGYKMPEPIPQGFVIKDGPRKKEWKIGNSIGKGGFGEIYCAALISEGGVAVDTKTGSFPFVIKIEPQENGPLFVEMHFFMKVAKQEDMAQWMNERKLKSLNMPSFLGSGSFDYKDEKYRFLVMDRYGQNLWSIFTETKVFPCATVLQIGLQIIDVLEYIHSKGYAHCDIKGSNLVLGLKPGTENRVHLVDYGLASKYTTGKEFKPDVKNAHNGTIEYTSRDMHQGVTTRRGDLEVLGFNLLHWVNSSLPWEDCLANPEVVQTKKTDLMTSISKSTYVKQNFPKTPAVIIKFLTHVAKLKFNEDPNYEIYRKLFKSELKSLGSSESSKLIFSSKEETKVKKAATKENTSKNKKSKKDQENDDMLAEEDEYLKKNAVKRKMPKRKNDALAEKQDELVPPENDNILVIKRKIAKKVAGSVAAETQEQENGNASTDEESVPIKKQFKKNVVKNGGHSVSDDQENKKTKAVTRKNLTKKKAESWKDCPTAVASNVVIAGEYNGTKDKEFNDVQGVTLRRPRKVKN